ncbi:polysaccharide deacetylase family protein [Aureibaculum sp. A20]|uniref:Polysaccharide deacetylase family protein n=1 Tax=Aureibaculum flavum TaxID=2795986 RepID=A0ABS0WN92_9FLAO|nr:polysaccharide deacetylase family protein [Aureibaculum flavum]MBJ2173426.1 polysaccharide deacetylase family protein [Aureibaculum flavum]
MKNLYIYAIVTIVTAQFSYAQNLEKSFKWPENKKAAVSLTFDDGQDSHLDNAIPLLDSLNVKATFYCPGNSESLHNRTSEWKKIVENGHELGNHSLFHPCDGTIHDWVKPEYDLNRYTKAQIRTELYTANTLLKAIDGKINRTYAYPCSNFKVQGDTTYVDVVKKLFSAARSDGPIPTTMENIDINYMPSWDVNNNTGKELIAYVKEARDNGTIATFMFHSVGGGYLNVSTEALQELLIYLKANEKDYWVDTFYNITHYIKMTLDATE